MKNDTERLDLPRIGLGCMGMSEFYGSPDDAASLALLRGAFDHGYRHFDTADMYGFGGNERLLGQFLADLGPGSRAEVVVATKVGIRRSRDNPRQVSIDSHPAYIADACEQSLQRLGIDTIDLLYLHRRNPEIPIAETIGAMERLREQGKIRWIGLSEVSHQTLREAAQVAPISALQSEYSLWTRDPERETFSACESLGVLFVAYSPLGRGFFATTSSDVWDQEGDLRRMLPRFQNENLTKNLALRKKLADVARRAGLTVAQTALAWVLRRPFVRTIPGSRRMEHLEANFEVHTLRLSEDLASELDAAFDPSAVAGERYPVPLLRTVNV